MGRAGRDGKRASRCLSMGRITTRRRRSGESTRIDLYRRSEASCQRPYFFALEDGSPLSLAALWEHWGKGDDSLESFTIIFADDNQRHTY